MPNRLLKICLDCDHCRITFNTKDVLKKEEYEGDMKEHPRMNLRVGTVLNRDRIKEIRCELGLITDHLGLEKRYCSETALISAAKVEGDCKFYSPEEED